MMPVIRISDSTFERLQRHAVPLEDTVDDVVNKALDALDRKAGVSFDQSRRATSEVAKETATLNRHKQLPKTPQKEFREPLVRMLIALGGGSQVAELRKKIEPTVRKSLLAGDLVNVSTGEPRWWNAICWERNDLLKEGLIRPDSPRGYWELSDAGWQAACENGWADV